jgi:DNA polymerase III subunit epsilon
LISGIERVRLARAAISAEGVMAVIAPSTEPGIVEVFALSGGRLVAHEGFEPADETGLKLFARGVLVAQGSSSPNGDGTDEARVVAAYLRRQGQTIEAVRLGEAGDLLAAVRRAAPEPDEKAGA